MPSRPKRSIVEGREGFSLLEILVSTAIIGTLLAITYPRLAALASISRLDGSVRALSLELQKSRLRAELSFPCGLQICGSNLWRAGMPGVWVTHF